MRLAFEEPAEAIGAQHLQQTDQHIAVVLADETRSVDLLVEDVFHAIHIVFQQPILPGVGQFCLCLPEQGRDVVLQGPFHPALEIDEMDAVIIEHDVAALKVAEHKIFVIDMRDVGAQRFEVIDQLFLVIGDLQGVEKIIFEVEQVAEDGLLAKFFRGDRPTIIQPFVSDDLEVGKLPEAFLEKRIDLLVMALLLELAEQGEVAKVFL